MRGRAISDQAHLALSSLGFAPETIDTLILSGIIVGTLTVLRSIAGWIILKRSKCVRIRYRLSKLATYTTTTLAIFLLGSIWFSGFQNLSTFLGLLTAGIAIALKDLVASVAGWFYILTRKPFQVGDRITIGDQTGDIIDQRLFRFTMLEVGNWVDADHSTGRVVHVPNSHVLTMTIANYTAGFAYIWNELPVMVTFESDWEKAKAILQGIADEGFSSKVEAAARQIAKAAESQMIWYSKLTPKVWTSVADSGIVLTVRYLCEPRQRRCSAELIWESVLRQFARCEDIDLAYPTVRYFANRQEGKSGTGGPGLASREEPARSLS